MFGFVKNLGKKKDNGFYLELKEEATKPDTKAEPAASNGAKPAAAAPAAPAQPAAAATEQPAKPSRKEAAAAAKAAKIEAAKAARAAEEQKQVAKPAVAAKPQEPTPTTFADKYLMPNGSNGRRRPGANMSSYLDLARQVKTPNPNNK